MMTLILLQFMTVAAAEPPTDTSKPVGITRDQEKELLEKHKQARPRLPMPPVDPANPLARVNNGAFRAYYLPAELRETGRGAGGGRESDPAMTLDSTFKVKLFWIASRANNCYYCLGHQEYKLLGAGVTDDEIAALDGDWRDATPKERAAYDFTRKLTHTPHLITGADVEVLKKHYTPTQVLEILVTVAGYNSTNRWTDGLNIPAEANGTRFKREGITADFSTFQTPTSGHFAEQRTTVAPVKLSPRAPLESRTVVEAMWKEKRVARLPLGDQKAIGAIWSDGRAPMWAALLATFPTAMKGRVAGLRNGMEKGSLSAKLKAEIAWVAARNDRAWYALAIARDRLKRNGFTDDQVFALDGDRRNLPETEQAALALVETLTVSPWKVTDEMVERCRKSFRDAEVAELFYHTCNAAFFDRVTEVAYLPLDE